MKEDTQPDPELEQRERGVKNDHNELSFGMIDFFG